MKLGIIGCGNMASAITRGIVNSGLIGNVLVCAYDIDSSKSAELAKLHTNIFSTDRIDELLKNSEFILLAVKPQNFNDLFFKISQLLNSKHILISIAAGISIKKIKQLISKNAESLLDIQICRVMPNLPAFVFKGMSGIAFDNHFKSENKNEIEKLFNAIGKIIIVDDENKINEITAVSGSGPAYFYYFTECFIEAAKELGFDDKTAAELVYATVEGALDYLKKSDETPETLRKRVTSPGGTTEAAIRSLTENKFKENIIEALKRAAARAVELGS